MKKNTAGQIVGGQMVSATDGSEFTGAVTVYVTGDGGTQAAGSVGAGACAHEGHGFHTYAPAQAETNYDHVAFTFVGTGAVPATAQTYPTFPQTGDNFARIGAPVGASISADVAAVKTETASIQTDTNDIQTRLPAALVSGRMDSSTGAMGANVLTATAINADAFTAAKFASDVTTELQSGLATAAALATVDTVVDAIQAKTDNLPTDPADQSLVIAATDAVMARLGAPAGASMSADVAAVKTQTAAIEVDTADIQTRLPAALVSGRIDASVGAAAANVLTAAALAADAVAEIADAVWDEPLAGHVAAGSAGAELDAAASAGDPWATDLPGVYGAGTAGALVVAIKAVDDAVKAKTDQLTFTTGVVHSDAKRVAGVVLQQNGSGTQSIGGPA